jgi:hypothetical protein
MYQYGLLPGRYTRRSRAKHHVWLRPDLVSLAGTAIARRTLGLAHRRRPRPPIRHCYLSDPGSLLQPTHDPIRLPFGTAGAQASRRGQWTRPLERGCKTQCGRSVRKPKPTGLGWRAARWLTTRAAHPTSSGQWSRARLDGTTAVTVTAAGRSATAATNAEHLH